MNHRTLAILIAIAFISVTVILIKVVNDARLYDKKKEEERKVVVDKEEEYREQSRAMLEAPMTESSPLLIYGLANKPDGTVRRWQTAATSVEIRTPKGLVRVHWAEDRLFIYQSDLAEIVPHWSAPNQLELDFIPHTSDERH